MKRDFFKNKTAIVTGAGRGIGLCIAKFFLDAQANVIVAELDQQLGQKALSFLDSPNSVFVQTDVADEESVRSMVQKTSERYGQIHFLINNAAIAKNIPITELSYKDWQGVIHTGLSGAFLCAKHSADHLKKARGAIVNIASTRALMSEANTEAYSAVKGGIVTLTHALSISLAHQVRVNCISPGWINTTQYLHGAPSPWQIRPEDHTQHPTGRIGKPEDIAAMILYLCGPDAEFITGQNFVIDGGMTKKMIYWE